MDAQTAQQNAVAIAVIQTEVAYLKTEMASMAADLKAIRAQLDQARGGWRVLLLVGGASGALAEAIHWAVSHFKA